MVGKNSVIHHFSQHSKTMYLKFVSQEKDAHNWAELENGFSFQLKKK